MTISQEAICNRVEICGKIDAPCRSIMGDQYKYEVVAKTTRTAKNNAHCDEQVLKN